MENRDKLVIVWSSEDYEVAKKMVLLYSSVILPRGYFSEVTLMIWGPSARLVATNKEIQELLKKVISTGVKVIACIVCVEDFGVSKELQELGVELTHTGEILANCLKNGWSSLTF